MIKDERSADSALFMLGMSDRLSGIRRSVPAQVGELSSKSFICLVICLYNKIKLSCLLSCQLEQKGVYYRLIGTSAERQSSGCKRKVYAGKDKSL